jgi:glucose-1-phosphate thymidylyltransferase
MNLAYLTIDSSQGVPFTLDQAYSFVRNSRVAFGFPDILFGPPDAFEKILTLQSTTKADAVLGLWRRRPSPKYDGVHFDGDGNVREVILGSSDETVRHSWAIAVWSPVFTTFLHDYVSHHRGGDVAGAELTAGHAMRASVEAGLKLQAVVISEEFYLDIGTPDDLARAIQLGLDGRL